jgi:hypothetical protein
LCSAAYVGSPPALVREAAVAVAAHVERIDAVQRRVIGVHGDAQLHRINLDVDCARRGDSENEAKHVQPKDGAAAGEGTPRFAARAVAARVRFEGAAQAEFTTAARGGRVERLVGMGRWGGHHVLPPWSSVVVHHGRA